MAQFLESVGLGAGASPRARHLVHLDDEVGPAIEVTTHQHPAPRIHFQDKMVAVGRVGPAVQPMPRRSAPLPGSAADEPTLGSVHVAFLYVFSPCTLCIGQDAGADRAL